MGTLSGYFDDGTHFRVYFINGLITGIVESQGGGYSAI
jgi:hypothetical protein